MSSRVESSTEGVDPSLANSTEEGPDGGVPPTEAVRSPGIDCSGPQMPRIWSSQQEAAVHVLAYLSALRKRLNPRTRGFDPKTEANVRPIMGRLTANNSVEDLCLVVDFKGAEWGPKPDMWQFLRPETIFAPTHWDGYLNAAIDWDSAGRPFIPPDRRQSPAGRGQLARGRSASEYTGILQKAGV